MSNAMEQLDQALIETLRSMARQSRSPSEMFQVLKLGLGNEAHIVTILKYCRQALGLTLADVKPIAALSRNEPREIEDVALVNALLSPAILKHRADWDMSKV
jgi:hypothetical protein